MKRDRYSKARGGWSRILDMRCEKCDGHVCYYQKDGPGHLKRMYIDRIIDIRVSDAQLNCPDCSAVLATKILYVKENRPAYRLFVGAVTKHIVKSSSINKKILPA